MRFQDKVCVITGGTAGIGLGIAEKIISEGASVIACSVDKNIEEIVALLRTKRVDQSQRVEGLYVDVTSAKDRQTLVKFVEKEFGRIDVLFVNAGIVIYKKSQFDLTEEEYDRMININIKAAFFTIELLRKGKDANILVTSSATSVKPIKLGGIYTMTKSAVNNMVIWLAQELMDQDIRVNAILPGMVKTNMTKIQQKMYLDKYPRSLAEPWQIAAVAAMITSRDGSFINGENYLIDSKVFDWSNM
ncbi:short-chain dehydrogenase reductase sdr [Stylonychia lemnae]|uniref:Short-chain dehydrogenase reductase sdr n=1 Tax=Stylonychia lemnae TaxID=5949 RepID=A0A077ZXU6_STYLE|nr:short-chain dehydrogenase reductase sdr [Stylonychia lemnae]|eukprot:CDW73351.1 short-chain dehydrogenase reductase sdr [Stylonychia lemnae]